jgi:hypothetical protein
MTIAHSTFSSSSASFSSSTSSYSPTGQKTPRVILQKKKKTDDNPAGGGGGKVCRGGWTIQMLSLFLLELPHFFSAKLL